MLPKTSEKCINIFTSNLLNLTNQLVGFFIYFYCMKSILDKNFKGKKVLVRVDFNVPLDKEQNIIDDSRISIK